MGTERGARSGIVALTTDFGLADPYVGQMKAVILARARSATIVDVTHGVPAQDVRVGAFFLERSAGYFPPGTVHVAVVDPGVGTERALLVAEAGGQVFLGPDNGLLDRVLDARSRVWALDVGRCALPAASRTFHGRDVLAPAAAHLVAGGDVLAIVREEVKGWVHLPSGTIEVSNDGKRVEVAVLFADRYGNLVLDLAPGDLAGPLEAWSARIAGVRVPFARTYGEVRAGEPLLLVDSFDALEIAVRDGDAAARFQVLPGARIVLEKRS